MFSGAANAVAIPSQSEVDAGHAPVTANAKFGPTQLAQTQPAPAPTAGPLPVQPAADEPIGNVANLAGSATVTRNNIATPLKLQDDIFLNDVLQTSANSTLGLVEVPEGTTATSANNVAIKLYPDPDGHVGRIEVNGRDGSRLSPANTAIKSP